jgi:hypothetical protein
MEKFLKRFQRLENTTLSNDLIAGEDLKPSKRFTRLELNDKKIEFVLEDKVANHETAPPGKGFYFLCPFCGKQNSSNVEICAFCRHQLKNQYIPDYSGKSALLKKCHCGAMNLKERKNCWVCGRDFSLWGDEEVKEAPENVITLNIDGKIYKSTDQGLPQEILDLMEDIRREGYSDDIVQKWVKERKEDTQIRKTQLESRLTEIRWGLLWRIIGLIAFIIFIFIQIRAFHH